MKRLLISILGLVCLVLPMWSAVEGKFTYSYPPESELPYDLGYQYSIYDLKESTNIGWKVMYLNEPVTLSYQVIPEEENAVEVVFDPSYLELKDVVIPETVIGPDGEEYTVTTIGKMAFDDCPEIRSVIMANSITRIEDYAFNMCENKVLHQIGYIKFSENLTHIGNYAFRNCHNLTTGYYKEGDQYKIKTIDFVHNVDYPIYGYAGQLTGLDDYLLLPATVKYIGKHAFEGCYFEKEGTHLNYGLCKVKIPNPSCEIDDYAFAGCKFLELITLGEELNYSGLKVTNPETTETGRIGNYAFADCNLMRLDIPSSIVSIGEYAFSNCFTKQRTLTPRTYEGRVYFDDLNWFYPRSLFNNETGQWNNWNFHRSDDKAYIKNYDDFLDRWHTNTVTIHSETTNIAVNAFANNPQLEKVIINGSMEEIGAGAFRNCNELKEVKLPHNLIKINSSLFSGCSALNEIEIPENVTEIGDSVFYNCTQLKTIVLPSNLEKLNPYTFYGCESLYLPTIPDNVNIIGEHAFHGCKSITSFSIPANVTSIGEYAFADCYIHEGRRTSDGYSIFYGLTEITIGDGVTSIGAHAFDGCRHLGQITIGNSVMTIGDYAFQNCMSCQEEDCDASYHEVTLPNSVNSIGDGLFQGSTFLPGITLGENITDIPDYAFAYCSDLSTLNMSPNVDSISKSAFIGCYNLTDLDEIFEEDGLENGIYYEGDEVVSALPNIDTAKIKEGVTKIRDGAFANCGALTTIEFPSTLKYIGSHAFENCVALESADLFNVEMGDSVYSGCTGIYEVIIHQDFTKEIRDNWFAGCVDMSSIYVIPGNECYSSENGLLLDSTGETLLRVPSGIDYLEIPETVTKIGEYACSNCFRFEGVEIPATVEYIGAHAFDGCYTMTMYRGIPYYDGMSWVIFDNLAVKIGEYAFNNCKNLNWIYWNDYEYGDGVAESGARGSIGAYAFSGCDSMEFTDDNPNLYSAVIDTLEPYAFANTPNLISVQLPEYLETIGEHAFENCENLTSLIFPEKLNKIGRSAFRSTALTSLDLPDSIEEIGDSAFMDCSQVMSLKLPSNLKKINPYTFYKCFSGQLFDEYPEDYINLTVEIPNSVESIGEYAFYGCAVDNHKRKGDSQHNPYSASMHYFYKYGLSSVSIGEGVRTIGAHAFDGCSHLLEVNMGDAVTSIGDYAFNDCFKESFQGVREVEYTLTGIIKNKEGLNACPIIWEIKDYTPQPLSLPEILMSLGEGAFNGCDELPAINFPSSLETIPEMAFNGCKKLTKIELLEGLKNIGNGAFTGCQGVKEISIPASLENGSRVFVECDSVVDVYYHAVTPKTFDEGFFSPKVYASNDAVVHAPNALLETLKGITPWALFYKIEAQDETLVHLDRVLEIKNGLRFRVLSNKPHPYCEVAGPAEQATGPTTYEVPEYVVNIDPTSDYFGQSYKVIRIGNDAFENDLTLVGIDIPTSVFDIGQEAFNGCKNLPEITLPVSVNNIGERAFANCYGLTFFEVPPLVTRLNPEVLRDCRGLYSIRMHDDIEELCTGALMDCRHLRAFERSENWKLRLIDDYALKNCIELETINIPEGVTKIGKEAFYYCQKLNTAALPTSLLEMGEKAFDDCEVLSTIKVYTETPPVMIGERHLTDQNCKIYVQAKSLDDYKQLWSVHEHRIEPGIIVTQPSMIDMPQFIPGSTYKIAVDLPLQGQTMTWLSENQLISISDDSHDGTMHLTAVGSTNIKVKTDQKFYHDCYLNVYPQLADANWDGVFDVSDAVNIANYVVENRKMLNNWWETERPDFKDEGEWNEFYYRGADVNKDDCISVADATSAIKMILNSPVQSSRRSLAAHKASKDRPADALVINLIPSSAPGGACFPIALDSSVEYVALQADITVPEGMILKEVVAGNQATGHALTSRRIDERTMRVVIFDFNNAAIAGSGEPVFNLIIEGDNVSADDIELSSIFASDSSSNSYELTSKIGCLDNHVSKVADANFSAISTPEGVIIGNATGKKIIITNVEGRVIKSFIAASDSVSVTLPSDIYIITVEGSSIKINVK